MKNMKKQINILVFFVTACISLTAQKNSKLSYGIEIGLNTSDFESGHDYVNSYLPLKDYTSVGTSGGPNSGYNINLGTQFAFHERFDLQFQTGYQLFRYNVRGSVDNLKPDIDRPLNANIPISLEGDVNFHFWNVGLDLIHNFSKSKSGLNASLGLDYMFNLTPNWNVDVISETGVKSRLTKIPDEITQSVNNLIMTDLRLGYNFNLKNGRYLSPSLGMHIGLNELGKADRQKTNIDAVSLKLKFSM